MIYLDNAATTKMHLRTLVKMLPFMTNRYGNPSSSHKKGIAAKKAIDNARSQIAFCVKASPDEIYFTSGGSEANNMAIRSAAEYGRLKNKKHIVTTAFEHHSVLRTLHELEKEGFEVTYVKPSKDGIIYVHSIRDAIRKDTCLVSVMAINNELGTITDTMSIGNICKENGILFHVDGVQACGHIPIDVNYLNVDYLSMSAHKFNGPKGIGALYIKNKAPVFPVIFGGQQEQGKRAGTENVVGIVGMGHALFENCKKIVSSQKRKMFLATCLLKSLAKKKVKGLMNGPFLAPYFFFYPGILNISFNNVSGRELADYLSEHNVCVSIGSACMSNSHEPSYVLKSIGLSDDRANSSIRISFDDNISTWQIKRVSRLIARFVKGYQNV